MALVLASGLATGCPRGPEAAAVSQGAPPPAKTPAALGPRALLPSGAVIRLELAISDEERAQGLMYRESLAPGTGMVFLFEQEERHGFWMKNCHFPLDMIFLKLDGTVADVLRNVPPCAADPCPTYEPAAAGRTVIEVNAGAAAANGVEPGKKVLLQGVPGR